jgi:hypothetical protein
MLFDPDPEAKEPEDMDEGKIELETCPTCMKSIKDYIDILKR